MRSNSKLSPGRFPDSWFTFLDLSPISMSFAFVCFLSSQPGIQQTAGQVHGYLPPYGRCFWNSWLPDLILFIVSYFRYFGSESMHERFFSVNLLLSLDFFLSVSPLSVSENKKEYWSNYELSDWPWTLEIVCSINR